MIQRLRQTRLYTILADPFRPRSEKPDEAFRERTIRFFVGLALIFFTSILLNDFPSLNTEQLLWYGTIYGVASLVLLALYFRRIQVASRLMIFSLLIILLDVSKAYWSPGTIIFGLLFTFMFQMILRDRREVFSAVLLNLALYTYITFTSGLSPLSQNDYFSRPILALLTTYVAHLCIIGVAHYIRREQRERSRAEFLMEKQGLDILRQFLDHTSHDLRTPITRLKTRLYVIERKYAEIEESDLAKMKQALAELELMVSGMLEMLELDDTNKFEQERLSLDSMIRDVISLYDEDAKLKEQALDYHAAKSPIIVSVDNIYFRRAIANILENAIAYTPEKGQISIRTEQQAKEILIEIRDTGIGIAAEHLPFIFEPFYRADAARNQDSGRNGLGLAISKKIIDMHHGEIQIESLLGEGTCFRILLPKI